MMWRLVLLFSLAITPAWAEDKLDCENAVTQAEMNMCAAMDYEKADAELNKIYAEVRGNMREWDRELSGMGAEMAGAEKALTAAQRGWIAYRDGACELAGFEARGGSMEPMVVSGCLAEMTTRRTAELKKIIEENGR
jgi:uncharacterized protein YecT (DUF1311 family)